MTAALEMLQSKYVSQIFLTDLKGQLKSSIGGMLDPQSISSFHFFIFSYFLLPGKWVFALPLYLLLAASSVMSMGYVS